MANVSIWAGVQVAVQSALGAAKTVTAITKANPGVASSTAHGFTDGQYILNASQGMYQVDSRVFRVSGAAANAYNLEGEDTTLYDTFSSGSSQLITFGTTASTFTGLSGSGGDYEFIDISTIHLLNKQSMPGQSNPGVYNFESFWDVADAGLLALKSASDSKAQRAFRFSFTNGQKFVFTGYVGCSLLPQGNAFEKVTCTVAITMKGSGTVLAT